MKEKNGYHRNEITALFSFSTLQICGRMKDWVSAVLSLSELIRFFFFLFSLNPHSLRGLGVVYGCLDHFQKFAIGSEGKLLTLNDFSPCQLVM